MEMWTLRTLSVALLVAGLWGCVPSPVYTGEGGGDAVAKARVLIIDDNA
jgi:hypothetical protein